MTELKESHTPTTGSMATRREPEPRGKHVKPKLLYGRMEYLLNLTQGSRDGGVLSYWEMSRKGAACLLRALSRFFSNYRL